MLVDRRNALTRAIVPTKRSSLFSSDSSDEDMEVDQDESESIKRLIERWRFDMDDAPTIGPEGPDEQDRILVDDYDTK